MKNKNSLRDMLLFLGLMGALTACTPADIDYCSKFGVAGTAEYGKCLDYYQQQEAAFGADAAICAAEADETYPTTLYDFGHFEHVMGGFGPYGWHSGAMVRVEPDYRHNAEVDRLRARIITPCMQAHGWNSPNSWQAGRHEVKPQPRPRSTPAPQKLPWLQ